MKRKIGVVTASRAEFGLLKPLMEEVKKDPGLKLQLIVTGMHLSPEFGLTYQDIENEGFVIDEKVEMVVSSDTAVGVCKSMGLAMIGLSEAYERLKPDILVLLGDRFEMLSAAAAALIGKIPVAHIAGGELTEGIFDDAIRHSITKMSHLHFTILEKYKRRVIQLGENPDSVFNVGALGMDVIRKLKLLPKEALECELNFRFNKKNVLVTFHPVTLETDVSASFIQLQSLFGVLDQLRDTNIIFTKSNADTGGRAINKMIDGYVSENSSKAAAFTSLGHLKYFSLMRFVDAVAGNSSSGIVEAPSFKIGTINIGDRQKGRVMPQSIISCEPAKDAIRRAFNRLYSDKFQRDLKKVINPYGDGHAAKKIAHILKTCRTDDILKKRFCDVKFSRRETAWP